jgi:uncharacterized membrane protein YjfL (UPF0719 family)
MEITTWAQTWVNLAISLTYGVLTVVLSAVVLYVLDHYLYRRIDFQEELRKGNMAASLFYSALLLFVGVIVTLSVN